MAGRDQAVFVDRVSVLFECELEVHSQSLVLRLMLHFVGVQDDGRGFPPNDLHKSWRDELSWESGLEN